MQALNVRFLNNLFENTVHKTTPWKKIVCNVKRNFYCNTPGTELKTPQFTSSFFMSSFLCPKRHFDVVPLNDPHTPDTSRGALAQHGTTKCSTTQRYQRRGSEVWGDIVCVFKPFLHTSWGSGTSDYMGISLSLYHWPLSASNSLAVSWECCNSSTTRCLQAPCSSRRTSCLTHAKLIKLSMAASAGRALPAHLCWDSAMVSVTRALWTGFRYRCDRKICPPEIVGEKHRKHQLLVGFCGFFNWYPILISSYL